jgi:hypothetical protein
MPIIDYQHIKIDECTLSGSNLLLFICLVFQTISSPAPSSSGAAADSSKGDGWDDDDGDWGSLEDTSQPKV